MSCCCCCASSAVSGSNDSHVPSMCFCCCTYTHIHTGSSLPWVLRLVCYLLLLLGFTRCGNILRSTILPGRFTNIACTRCGSCCFCHQISLFLPAELLLSNTVLPFKVSLKQCCMYRIALFGSTLDTRYRSRVPVRPGAWYTGSIIPLC